jgi:hypothetical protein
LSLIVPPSRSVLFVLAAGFLGILILCAGIMLVALLFILIVCAYMRFGPQGK